MKNTDRFLKKFSLKERREIAHMVERILQRDLAGTDCKKLKGFRNVFRVRKGNVRIVFELVGVSGANILAIERRSESTYKL